MKISKNILASVFAFVLLHVASIANAGGVVVVHPGNNSEFDRSTISKIFLAKTEKFPNGQRALPVDQDDKSLVRALFIKQVLKKPESKLKAYWAQQMFTGQGTPPKVAGKDDDVKAMIADNPSVIGYIDETKVDDTVKVVYKF